MSARTALARVAILASALFAALVAFEGFYSLVIGKSLLRDRGAGVIRTAMRDDDRMEAALRTGGPYAVAIDPDVGFTMKPRLTWKFHGVPSTVDEHGSRARIGPAPHEHAMRIVLLGDSVTFGFGVADDQTLAHRLEAVLGELTPDGEPSPAVFTLAVPGWNVWNCCRALENHLGRLRPDIVIYTPVENDLYDSFATTEAGFRSHDFDPAVGGVRTHVSYESFQALLTPMATRMSMVDAVAFKAEGGLFAIPPAIATGIAPESKRRWASFTSRLNEVRVRLAERGAKFAVSPWFDDAFEWQFVRRVLDVEPAMEVVPWFSARGPADLLEGDPHPNARCVDARAAVIAKWLVARGWVDAREGRLVGVDKDYAARWAPLPAPSAIAARCREDVARWRAQFRTEIDLEHARGFHQLYGGVGPDFTVGRALWGSLVAQDGGELRLRIDRLGGESGVYPLSLEVRFGSETATVVVPMPEADASPLDLGTGITASGSDVVDVAVRASNWIVERANGTSRLASFRLLRVGF